MATQAVLAYSANAAPAILPSTLETIVAAASVAPTIQFLNEVWGITKATDVTSVSGTTVTRTITLDLTAAWNADFPNNDPSLFIDLMTYEIGSQAFVTMTAAAPVLS